MSDIKETAYDHVIGSRTFSITAAERWSMAMVNRLKAQYPDEVEICHTNKDGSMVAHMPTSWMRIVPKRTRIISDEQKERLANQMRSLHASKSR